MLQHAQTNESDFVSNIYSKPYHEASLYHDEKRYGYFTVGWSTRSGRMTAAQSAKIVKSGPEVGSNLWLASLKDPDWRRFVKPLMGQGYQQKSFPLSDLGNVLTGVWPHIPMSRDDSVETTSVWISQAEFSRPNRQKINLAHIAVCWVDIDLWHENSPAQLRSMTEDRALALVLARCLDQGIPEPSIILWTGRGLAVKWLVDTLPKAAYPRWAAVQKCLVDAFADLGADASSRDASRVLRLPGTYNPKSSSMCMPIHVQSFWGDPVRILFNDLADAVLPFTREQLQKLKKERLENPRRKWLLENQIKVLEGDHKGNDNLLKFNPIRLAWLQVDDFRKLAELKPVGSRPEGWTNSLVWMATSALAMAVWADADRWNYELAGLVSELAPHWDSSRVYQTTSTVRSRMKSMATGEWVEYEGKKKPPIYTPSHKFILDALAVTDEEASNLKVILPESLAKERTRIRDKERKQQARRASGMLDRESYMQKRLLVSLEHEQIAVEMRRQGSPVKAISEAIGLSVSATYTLIANHGARAR